MIPNGGPQDRFFYPTLTLMIDPYNIDIHFTDGLLELASLIQIKVLVSYMGFDERKPIFGVSNQLRLKQACSSTA